MTFQELKLAIITATDLGKDALHVHVGLIVLLGAAVLLRVRIGSIWPVVAVATVAVGGEVGDIAERAMVDVPPDWPAHIKDLWNTLFWPVALTAIVRWTRWFSSDDRVEQPLK